MLIRSDARAIPLADESVQCVVTSPPYWGLRSYTGDPGMIGLEETFDEHLENLVAVFREGRRVLRKDGTLWLNYGDAYSSVGHKKSHSGYGTTGLAGGKAQEHSPLRRENNASSLGLKHKDLMMMPARVAMALQADGWWLRCENVWHKPNPMPESVTDRPTNAHEKVFLLSKSPRYFYDAAAVRMPCSPGTNARRKDGERRPAKGSEANDSRAGTWKEKRSIEEQAAIGANLRNVWKIPTQGCSEAHFATFPEKLVEPCILAGTSEKGCCAECGASWERETERTPMEIRRSERTHDLGRTRSSGTMTKPPTCKTIGWRPSCECGTKPVPCVVLDPFAGSGTVVRVATRLNRRGIGCDLSYQDIAKKRTSNVQRQLPT